MYGMMHDLADCIRAFMDSFMEASAPIRQVEL